MNRLLRPFRWFGSTSLAHSLRFRLILLVLLASLPTLALLFLTASQQRTDAIDAGQNEARRLARLVSADQSNVSDQIELVLSTLTDVPETDVDCTRELQKLTMRPSVPTDIGDTPDLQVESASFETVHVVNDRGAVLCSAGSDDSELPAADHALADSAFSSGQFVSGNYRTSISGSMIVTYAAPVQAAANGERRAIVATVHVYALSTFAREADLPDDSFILVFNSDGTLEQRWPAAGPGVVGESLVGTPVVDDALNNGSPGDEDIQFDDSGFVFGIDNFWTPGPDGGVKASFAVVAMPEALVVQNANEQFNQNLGKLAIAAIIGFLAVWIGADLFIGRDSETRKGQIRDYYHTYVTGDLEDLDEVIGPGYVDRTPAPDQAPGIDGLRQGISAFRSAFPDGQLIVRELLSDHDKVVARVTLSGTHIAPFGGESPSGKQVVADGVETFRFANGMVVESWSMFGELRPRRIESEATAPAPVQEPGFFRRIFRRGAKPSEGSEEP